MFALVYIDNDTAHDDLVVTLADDRRICDSYYFAIDDSFSPEREDATKTRAVLTILLRHWIHALESMHDLAPVLLPFDLSDQYTRCIQCRQIGSAQLELVMGYSHTEGWSFLPSKPEDWFNSSPDFVADGVLQQMPKHQFIAEIQASIERLYHMPSGQTPDPQEYR
ncbi:MAG: hypothetical protein IT186_19935 [Acidobacteria bacterium]|nr:hypothetical protein [Acidobacteriota bacterium]